jgi:hypothetical protein
MAKFTDGTFKPEAQTSARTQPLIATLKW